jgi:tRNA-dihydrouridine synthase
VSPQQAIKIGPGYQVPYAQRVKAEVGLPTMAVGLITEAEQAESIIANNEADIISIARAMLYDPAGRGTRRPSLALVSTRRSSIGARSRAGWKSCSRTRTSASVDGRSLSWWPLSGRPLSGWRGT